MTGKRAFILILTIILFASMFPAALAGEDPQKISVGATVKAEDTYNMKLLSASVYDKFMNIESGSAEQFIVVSFEITNLMTTPLYIQTQTKAILSYNDNFEYNTSMVLSNPGGTYENKGTRDILYVYNVDSKGKVTVGGSHNCSAVEEGFESINVKHYVNNYVYNPITDAFDAYDRSLPCIDSTKQILAPLEKRTYHYVFTVPNLVANDKDMRVLLFTIKGVTYKMIF